MVGRQKNRKPLDYVKPYNNIKCAWNDLQGMKRAYRYYRDKRDTLKKELQEKGLWESMPEEYRFEMYSLRIMMGILEAKITKCTAIYKKLQKEESRRQTEEKLKNIERRARLRDKAYDEHFTSPYQEIDPVTGVKFNVTKEHYEQMMEAMKKKDFPHTQTKDQDEIIQKIKKASDMIARQSHPRSRGIRKELLDKIQRLDEINRLGGQ